MIQWSVSSVTLASVESLFSSGQARKFSEKNHHAFFDLSSPPLSLLEIRSTLIHKVTS